MKNTGFDFFEAMKRVNEGEIVKCSSGARFKKCKETGKLLMQGRLSFDWMPATIFDDETGAQWCLSKAV